MHRMEGIGGGIRGITHLWWSLIFVLQPLAAIVSWPRVVHTARVGIRFRHETISHNLPFPIIYLERTVVAVCTAPEYCSPGIEPVQAPHR